MLQKSILFLHTADEDKNYTEEFELRKRSVLSDFSNVVTICTSVCILGLIGNGIIFCLLCCIFKRTKFIVYVANMAAADFLALLRVFITFIEFFKPLYVGTRARQLMFILFMFGHKTNTYFVAAMSTERCLTVFSPVWYQLHRKKCSTALVCALLWTASVMLSMSDHFLCTPIYISAFNMSTLPCKVQARFNDIVSLILFIPCMVFPTLALCIRMKIKPQQDFPARLDISIWVTVLIHLFLYPVIDIIGVILDNIQFPYYLEFYNLTLIFYCLNSSVNPFVYLLVGCWKREKGQEPFYTFLERALKDERKGMRRTQADPEQA